MTAAGLANGLAPPVQSVWMSSEGKFAFVEFRTPQDATNAMMLDGAMFHGRPLRIGRPAEMPNKSKPNLPNMGMGMGMGMAGMAGLAGLQGFSGLSSIQAPLSSILGGGGFGMAPTPQKPSKVKVHIAEFFNTAMTAAGLANGLAPPVQSVWMSSEGKFAFVEFRTPQDATNAMMLDGAMFHGRPLRIGRPAEMPNKSKPNLPNMGMGMGMGMAGMAGLAGLQGFSGLSSIQAPLSSILGGGGFGMAPTPQKPSKVIVLQNMVTLEDLENDDSYTDIMEDVRDECRNYGDIEEVIIPRPSKDGSTVTGLLKIFIKYSSIEGAEKARVALQGRKFASRTVIAEFMDELSFEEMSSSS
eukprot:CAMPEP_0184672538 /NCGR_PEP_ID=MMETSP0308-20130426/86154_1 /TAXON_ID=38269 /ORGANISM="Gloeochaete witrockiana, Strain SAG 46.84" /LENGTH=355 /DNA_ID=CAMNT_0027119877 /DNA_START=1712 /DNA_END=2780 /DNA_ORIENTATION=+